MASFESYPEPPKEDPKKKALNLKGILIIAVVALVLIGAVIGVMIWRNSTLSNAHQGDTESLNQGSAGVTDVSFKAVKISGLPQYGDIYGKKLATIKKIKGSKLSFKNSKLVKATSVPSVVSSSVSKKVVYCAQASISGVDDAKAAIYFNKKKRAIAMVYEFDLDELGVAEADFAVFSDDKTVPASLLSSVGISKNAVTSAKLTRSQDPSALSETQTLRSCTFKGDTGEKLKKTTKTKKVYDKKKKKKVKKKVTTETQVNFMSWVLSESYLYGAEGSSVTRTTTIALY